MWKAVGSLFILLFMLITSTIGQYSKQPCFRSDNGHLCVDSATNSNISLSTKGKGFINVNNENLLQIIGLAKEAWELIDSFRSNDLPEFVDTINSFAPLIDGPRSLSNRITTLEMQIMNASSKLYTKGKGGTFTADRLEVRLTNLEKKITNLVSLLSISECLSNPCQNGGTCVDIYNGFQCNCPNNWQGRLCELDVDECVRYMHTDLGCQNGAECKNTPGSYECVCATNWFGLHCTKKKNDCHGAMSLELCGNGVCINQPSTVGYTCICNQGWTTVDGVQHSACTKDVDECKENKHTCSTIPPVECRNTRGSFTCGNCPAGYEGDGFVCTDVNECLVNNGGCSVNPRVQCINTRGSFKCELCPPGYSGDGFNCIYKSGGACVIDNGGCHPNAECTVYAETIIQCTCQQGYNGNGIGLNGCIKNYKTIDPCLNNPCGSNGVCLSNSTNSFLCQCNTGYTGQTCNISIENPCLVNPCLNGECVPDPKFGGFRCNCDKGYFGTLCGSFLEECGGYFDTNNGSIQYPESNKTLTYKSNMNLNCAWMIDVNLSLVINISFVWIDIEKSIPCSLDYVEIKNNDDEDGRVLGKFCGNKLPINNSIISDSNSVIIRFQSDGSTNYRGFQINYIAIKPDCGGTLNIDSHGTLSSPGSPGKYPPNRDCYWTLNAIPGKRIQLNFFSLSFEHHINCSYDYLEIRDGFTQHSPVLTKLCNTNKNSLPPPIITSSSHVSLHFHSDDLGQDYGFQMTYSVIEGVPGCGGTYTSTSGIISSPLHLTSDSFNDLDSLNCEWHIQMPLHQKLKLEFVKNFGIKYSSNCLKEFLEIHDGPNIKSPLIGRYCGSTRYKQPIITNSNEVTLLFISNFSPIVEGFTIKYKTLCGGTFISSNGIIESPFYPEPSPQNKICEYLIEQPVGKAIRLSFLDMDMDPTYPLCNYNSLEIRDGDNSNSTKIALLCGNIKNLPKLPYISTHNYMWLKFSKEHISSHKGFRANYSTIDITCGGILKQPSGTIQSPKNPEQYLKNQICKWIISVDDSSQIRLDWLSFSLDNHFTCNNDYVEVYDNSIQGNASKIAKYCGSNVPPVLTSLGNRLTIVYKTDHLGALDGFMLNYTSLNKEQVCGGNFFTSEGFITSPNYPDDYPENMNCIWTINVPGSNQIELNFTQFHLEYDFDCRFADFVEIRNGGYSTSPLIGKYCGSKIPPTISSSGNSLFIKFVSDGLIRYKGFFMQWYLIGRGCGGTFNAGKGHIISPNYPLPVLETLECYYNIYVEQGSRISINISDLQLVTDNVPGLLCNDDFLQFYDGGSSDSKLLGTFCNYTHPYTILHSTSNQMYIKFRSSGFSKGTGFSLTYTTDCHVNLKGYQGAIEMVKEKYTNSDTCVWTIVAPKGSKVNITFTEFKISSPGIPFRYDYGDDYGDDDDDDDYGYESLKSPLWYPKSASNMHSNNFHYHCAKAKLIITEGAKISEINTALWKNNCSTQPHTVISSTKNIVRITYSFEINRFGVNNELKYFRIEWIVDGCGGVLNKLQGEFTSPNYPRFYSLKTTCEWNIIIDDGHIVEITIEDLWFKTSESCLDDNLAIYNGYDDSAPELLRTCHKQTIPITLTSSGNEAFIRFESVDESQRKRFKATYRTVESKCGGMFTAPQGVIHTNNYPQSYDSQSSCTWNIEIAETHLINLTFVDFSTQSSSRGNNDIVLVYDGNMHGKLLLNHSGNSIPPPVISSSNKLLISFEVGKHEFKAKGFKAIYSMACGAKLITNDSGIITNNPYFTNGELQNCTWTIISDIPQSKVTLTFTHIDIVHFGEDIITAEKSNITDRPCSNDLFHTKFRILDGPDSDAPEIITFCKSNPIPPPIVSNGPAMRIEYTDDSGALDSFSALYSVRSVACGGTYDSIRGTISSPNYPNNYFRDLECVWILKSSVGNLVSLNFIAFELEEDEFCNEDYVEIREGDSIGPVLGIFCGPNLPTNVTSGSTLWVKFRSNSVGSAKGFTADFKYVSKIIKSQLSGKISSPMYPRPYRDIEDYSWTIRVDLYKNVEIVINDFISTSEIHELKIYDGSNVETLILFELSSSKYNNIESKKTIISSDNTVFIRLQAGEKRVGGIRFLLSWTQIDALHLSKVYPMLEYNFNRTSFDYYLSPSSNTSVTITSPGYPHGYEPNLNVTWILHTESQYHIDIELIDIDFYPIRSSSNTHHGDYLNVETVDPDMANTILLETVYANPKQINDKRIVGKNKVILTFISNKSLNGTGFKVEARLRCGGQLRGPTGVISLSNTSSLIELSHSYQLRCTWNITVRPGRKILVKLITIKLSSHSLCVDGYILLKSGLYEDSPFIGKGKYCNESNESTVSTTDNMLQINALLVEEENIIKIEFEEKSINCGGQISLNDAYSIFQITSPSYPNIPPAHIECIWIVVAPPATRISVTIEDLDLFISEKCETEYLEFRDGAARFSRLISHFCNSRDIPNTETTDRFLYIKYFTDLTIPSNGFKLNVTIAKCGGTQRAARGEISSPNYPGSYDSNMDCEYKIIAGPYEQVLLKFVTVSLKRRYSSIGIVGDAVNNETSDDTLTIFDVDPLNKTRVKILTIVGSGLPVDVIRIRSSGQELIIKFNSYFTNRPFRMNNTQAKFLMSYETVYIDCFKNYDVESGEISSSPSTTFNNKWVYCIYKIKVPKGRRINVEIIKGKSIVQTCDTNVLPSEEIFNEKLEAYQKKDTISQTVVCIEPVINPISSNYMFESIANEMTLVYEKGSKKVDPDGFRLKFSSDKPSICGGITDASIKGILEFPIKNLTRGYCQWDLTNTNGTIVISTTFKVNESQISCQDNYLLLATYDDGELLKRYCPMSNTNDKFTILSPTPMVKLLVRTNLRKFNYTAIIEYNVNSCGGVMNGQKITITSTNYPKNYGQNLKCAWYLKLPEGNNVDVRFNDFDLDSSCDNNYVMLHDGPSPESPVLGKYCGNSLPKNLVATSNELWVVFSSENGKINKKGFNLTLESRQNGCGNRYAAEEGEISTRNYPNIYPNNEECEWIIAVLPGNRVSLQFVERFYLEQSVNCTKDYVQFFDFVNDIWMPIGSRFCGRQIPRPFNSSESKLKIRLRTDSDIQGDGFKARWSSTCGGVFTQNSGKIISPNYPKHYPNNIECNYTISAPGKDIKLTFNSFELEVVDDRCRFDSLSIYNTAGVVDNHTEHFVGTYCGTNVPHPMTFMDSVMMIFKTGIGNAYNGFEIQYNAVSRCGGEITIPGIIKYPMNIDPLSGTYGYPDNVNCSWIIRAPANQVVQIVFTKFHLERSSSYSYGISEKCPFDHVVVFDESYLTSYNSQYFGIFCGILDEHLPKFVSRTNIVYVQFVSDSSRGGEGFEAEIKFTYDEYHGCGGTIRLNQSNNNVSSFTLNNSNISLKTDLDCGWLILVKPSYVVQFQVVIYTETPKCSSNATNCVCSSIQIYDGPGRSTLKIRQYCPEHVDYPSVLSSNNEAFISYSSIASDVDTRFEIKITSVPSVCGPNALIVTNQSQVLPSVNYPLPYNNMNGLICTWFIQIQSEGQSLILRFTDLNLADTKDCSSNYLEIKYTPLFQSSYNTLRLCHEDHVFDFVSRPSNILTLTLHTVNDQKTPKKFRLEYMATTGCLTSYTKRYGYIHHGYHQLSIGGECKFTIDLGQSNLTISLFITTFYSLGQSSSSYLKVYDGPSVSSPPVTTILDSQRTPYAVYSTGPSLTIAYKIADNWSWLLDMSYTSTDQGRGCGGKMFNMDGTIMSPMYPLVYNKSSTCRWDIAVPRPNAIRVQFKKFNIGERSTCDTDYLEMFNVEQLTGESSFVAKYCGGDTPADFTTKTGAVFIRYVTSVHNTGTGWVLNFDENSQF